MTIKQEDPEKTALREALLSGFHKTFWEQFSKAHINDNKTIKWLFEFMLECRDRTAQTSSEIIRYMSDLNPQIVEPFVDTLIDKLKTNCHDGVTRCIFRMFQRSAFSEAQTGNVVVLAYQHLQDRSNAIAIRVFAVTTIYNITKTYPDLYDELVVCISENLSEESAGFRSRAGQIMNRTWK